MKKPYILGAIFARGGSKGVSRKNIKPLARKPLIAYAIELAKAVPLIDHVIVSTDDIEIAAVAREYGADIPFMRPEELAQDTSPELLAWKHAIETMEAKLIHTVDVMVSVPTTSPMRAIEDVEACLALLLASDADIVITVTPAHRNPYFNMVTMNEQGDASLVCRAPSVGRRQDAPTVYDMTTVAYAARREYILSTPHILSGRVKATIVPIERSLDIDTPLDFEFAEFLLAKHKYEKS